MGMIYELDAIEYAAAFGGTVRPSVSLAKPVSLAKRAPVANVPHIANLDQLKPFFRTTKDVTMFELKVWDANDGEEHLVGTYANPDEAETALLDWANPEWPSDADWIVFADDNNDYTTRYFDLHYVDAGEIETKATFSAHILKWSND